MSAADVSAVQRGPALLEKHNLSTKKNLLCAFLVPSACSFFRLLDSLFSTYTFYSNVFPPLRVRVLLPIIDAFWVYLIFVFFVVFNFPSGLDLSTLLLWNFLSLFFLET